jgi:hypothetical protein
VNTPGGTTITINDLIPGVQAALQNRADVSESQPNPAMRPSKWLKDSIKEITESYQFEELRVVGPPVNLSVPVGGTATSVPLGPYPLSTYPISQFLRPGDDYTLLEDPVIFIDFPSNQIGYPMNYMTPKAIQPLLNIPGGVPFIYSRFGSNFWFGVAAGQTFTVFLPYQRRHPFVDSNLTSSPVYLPASWHDILEFAAAERGAVVNRWNDQATFLHNLLYGDPRGKGNVGLIAERILQQERDMQKSTRQLVPMIQRY